MKTTVGILLLGLAGSPWICSGQQFSIDWYKIAGGGGTSSGGPFVLTGTIGQPDAGNLVGGTFTLVGGFWSGAVAVQQVGAPELLIANNPDGTATISWKPEAAVCTLQVTDTLTPAPQWRDVPNGTLNPMTVSTAGTLKFYRLRR